MKYVIDERADARAELKNLLDFNGFDYKEVNGDFCLVFADRGCKWTTVCRAQDGVCVILSRFPFNASNEEGQRFCCEANSKLLFGSVFPEGGELVCRTSADIFDGYMAYEAIARALEYNAGAVVALWEEARSLPGQAMDITP